MSCVVVRRVSAADADWVLATLGRRMARLVPHAPRFWNPAPDREVAHRRFLSYGLTQGGARGYADFCAGTF